MQKVAVNFKKVLILSIILFSFCFLFAGCNLTTSTPGDESVNTDNITLKTPEIATGLIPISQEEYSCIPQGERPKIYNEQGVEQTYITWNNTNYIKSPFADNGEGGFVLSVLTPNLTETRGYVFGVAETNPYTSSGVDYSKFTQIKVLDNRNLQGDVYYIADVNSFITEPQTYYFYVKALGVGFRVEKGQKKNYRDSAYSNIITYTLTSSLKENFTLQHDGYNLTWENLSNCTEYRVYVNGSLFATTKTNNCDLTQIQGKTLPTGEIDVYVKAIGANYYVGSQSNTITISDTVLLSCPKNFNINETFLASWENVALAKGYEINLVFPTGKSEIITTTNTTYNLSNKLSNVGKYYAQIKAVGEAEQNDNNVAKATTFSSLYTPFISFEKFETLNVPQNLSGQFINQSLEIKWDKKEGDKTCSYSLFLDYNSVTINGRERTDDVSGMYLIENNCTYTTFTLPIYEIIRDLKLQGILLDNEKINSFNVQVKANGYDYYKDSNFAPCSVANKTLSSPKDVKVLGGNVVWDTVADADYYFVSFNDKINNTTSNLFKTTNNYIKLSKLNLISNDNTISVQAISGVFFDSPIASYDYKENTLLSAPTTITIMEAQGILNISWDNVQNAKTYSLFLDLSNSQVVDGDPKPEGVVLINNNIEAQKNNSYSIELTAIHNKLSSELNITQKLKTYYFYVIANGYEGYEDSAKTIVIYENKKINEPVLSLNNFILSWNDDSAAQMYEVYLNETLIASNFTENSLNIYNFLEGSATYNFKVQAISNIYLNSNLSIYTLNYSEGQLAAPTLTLVNGVLAWDAVKNAGYYELYINGVLKVNNITDLSYNITTLCIEVGTYTIGLRAMSLLDAPSNISEISYRNTNVETFEITSVNTANYSLEFTNIGEAQSFGVYLNNTLIDTINPKNYGTTITYNYGKKLSTFKNHYAGDAVSVTIAAKDTANNNIQLTSSEFVYQKNNEADKFYYIFDTYYDNIIESQEELVYICLYGLIYEGSVDFEIQYSNNIVNEMNMALSKAESYLSTYSFKYTQEIIGNWVKLTIENNYLSDKTLSTGYTKPQNNDLWQNYVPNEVRGSSSFVTDNYIISKEVKNSDQLLWSIIFNVRPLFSDDNIKLLNMYNEAKNILNNIISKNASDYEKALIIAEYICQNSAYDHGYDEVSSKDNYKTKFHFLEGFFEDGLVVCDGYAKIFALLCNMENIKTYVVSGNKNGGLKGFEHAWNKIYLDIDGAQNNYAPAWYAVDLTDCDGYVNEQDEQMFAHTKFLLKDNDEKMGNRIINCEDYPVCNTSFDYYKTVFNKLNVYLNNSCYDGEGQKQVENMLRAILSALVEQNETCIDFTISKTAFNDYYSALTSVKKEINLTGANIVTYRSSYDADNYIILLTCDY